MIYYINGWNGKNSTKAKKLTQYLHTEVKHLVFDNNNYNEIKKIIGKNALDIDMLITSSTSSYIAQRLCYENNIKLVSINPVIDIHNTFNKMGEKIPEDIPINDCLYGISQLVLINKDDTLIDWNQTFELYKNNYHVEVFEKGGHKSENLEEMSRYIVKYIDAIF